MKTRLLAWWDDLRSSYWFIPAVMTVSAIILSFVSTAFDQMIGQDWVEGFGWVYANKPEGARAFLSTIAGSMIGVAGVTFSITIAAVVYATSQFGPRLLTNFMRDTGNQVTLGAFIATFSSFIAEGAGALFTFIFFIGIDVAGYGGRMPCNTAPARKCDHTKCA